MTELEGVVLGIVWSRGPCSAYVVHQRFSNSPTSGWASSTGSIYPAIARLEAQMFIKREAATGRGKGGQLEVTALGEERLREWITMLAPEMGGPTVDPVRSRAVYMGVLDPEERQAFLDAAERNARAALAKIEAIQPDVQSRHSWALKASLLGAELETRARLEWIERVRRLARAESLTDQAAAQGAA